MLAGLIKPTEGHVSLDDYKENDIRKHIGYLPQHPQFHSWMTGREFLIYAAQLSHLPKKEAAQKADSLLNRFELQEMKNRKIKKYSGGMKQRLGIAQAIIHSPKVLLLDEPVSALDPIGRRTILNLMEQLKKETTLLYSTHILGDAEEVSDEILLMHKGAVVESGSLDKVKQRHNVDKITLRFAKDTKKYQNILENLSSVIKTEYKKQTLQVYVTDPVIAKDEVLSLAVSEKWPLLHFEVGRTTLEDLFMKVVNEHAVADPI